MTLAPKETYQPRALSHLGVWKIEGLDLKVFGIVALGTAISADEVAEARSFVSDALPQLVAAEGNDDGLGSVIIHPGELGISILAHWWAQGSVLCQNIRRTTWDAHSDIINGFISTQHHHIFNLFSVVES